MKPLFLPILISFFICFENVYAVHTDLDVTKLYEELETNNKKLTTLAIKEGLIPQDLDETYLKEQVSQSNSTILWILLPIKGKIEIVDALKQGFKDEEGVIIGNPSEYYVNDINGILYKSIQNDKGFVKNKKGVGIVLETIAIQEGDFNDGSGQSKVETLKNYLGEERFEWYKTTFPKKYGYLIKMDSKK